MEKATHTITTVEAVNMAELAKEHAKKNRIVTIHIHESTLAYIGGNLIDKFIDADKFEDLVEIVNVTKDLGLNELSGDFIRQIDENHPVAWQNHLKGLVSDHSGASDQNNR